jgi:epoxyqueuosine reductase
MNWMERSVPKRSDPTLVQPGARSVIMIGVNYLPPAAAFQAGGETTGVPPQA